MKIYLLAKQGNVFKFASGYILKSKGRHGVSWTDARRPVPRLWIRSAEVRGERR